MIGADRMLAAEDTGKAGPLGLLVLIVLIVACYFLFKSMSKHLRRVREEFPAGPPAASPAAEAGGGDSGRGVPGAPVAGPAAASVPEVVDRVDPSAQ